MNTGVRIISYLIVGLFGVGLFMIGGSLVIWALHILMWNPPSPDFINNLPYDIAGFYLIATPLGLFLVGFGILLIVLSGAGFSLSSQISSTLRDEELEKVQATVSVKARCPQCNAVYFYRLPETDSDRTVTCQNCGRRYEVAKSLENTSATG